MRNQLNFIHNEKGVMFPSVLLLTTIVLLIFSTNLIAYQHDLKITHSLIEQMNAQTLFQMGYVTYKNEYLSNTNNEESIQYTFPNGSVGIKPTANENNIHLQIDVQTTQEYRSTFQKNILFMDDSIDQN